MADAKVLAVDDSGFMRSILAKLLNRMGYEEIEEAEDIEQALAKMEQVNPDLIFLDTFLKGKYATGFIDDIIENTPDAKVVMLSSLGEDNVVKESLEKGAHAYLQKPFDVDEVQETVTKLS